MAYKISEECISCGACANSAAYSNFVFAQSGGVLRPLLGQTQAPVLHSLFIKKSREKCSNVGIMSIFPNAKVRIIIYTDEEIT